MEIKAQQPSISTKSNIYAKVQAIRADLVQTKLKKSGKNKFSDFEYYTLDDILPVINKKMNDYKIFSAFILGKEEASLTLINIEDPNQQITFTTTVADAAIKGATPVQCLGGVHTYLKRYLYLNAFEIAESDILDNIANNGEVIPVKLDADLMAQANELKINLTKLATYYKKTVEQLTNEDLQTAIKQKQALLNGGVRNEE